jgi:hypothetical protein
MSDELFEPIKETDSEWVKYHKLAIEKCGENDLPGCIKELTRLLIQAGYDAVVIDDEPYWTVLLDHSLIISSSRYDSPNYDPNYKLK